MKLLRKLWNYQPDPEQAGSIQSRSLRGLALFLAIMACCTIVSRAADAMTIAVIKTASPQHQAITQTIAVDGMLEAADKVPVTSIANTMVTEVAVAVGDQVEEGALLFVLDTTTMRQELSQKQLELQRLQLQLAAQRESDALGNALSEQALDRAREDYEYAKEKAERATAAAMDEMHEARRAVDNYDGDKEDEDAYKAAVKALRAEHRAKIRAYEQALDDEAEVIASSQRAIDDTQQEKVNVEADLLSLDYQLKQLEISWLWELLATSGEVYAPVSGTVLELSVETGKMTGSDAGIYLSGEGALRFIAEIDPDQQKLVERGSALTLTMTGSKKEVANLTVTSLTPITDSDNMRISVAVPAGTGQPGQSASAEVRKTGQVYETCVPLSALYMSNSQYYVLLVRETESALGMEQVVEAVDVIVQEKNETMAAVYGPLDTNSKVVISSNRALFSGDRVRSEGAS